MPPRRRRVPKYRHYRPKNLAVVRIEGRDHYLGRYDSAESWEKYHRLIAEQFRNGWGPASPAWPQSALPPNQDGVSVNEMIMAYWRFASQYYRKNDKPTGEIDNVRFALKPLKRLYGSTPAHTFGPDALETIREEMIDSGLSRTVINARISRIKRAFRWASKKRLVPPETYHGLKCIEGLLRGRSRARETEPVKPVAEAHVRAVLPRVTPQVRAMVQVQELTGMRPQDIRNIRTGDIDVSGDVWIYTPWTHKTEHHGHVRRVAIGPRAQAVLRPFLEPSNPTKYVLSPKEAVAALRAERHAQRKTRRTPSERIRKSRPKRVAGDQYTKSSYESAIARACKRADVRRWGPNRLRHNCGTRVRKEFGIEGAAAVLGNSLGMVAEVYSEANFELAKRIMRQIG